MNADAGHVGGETGEVHHQRVTLEPTASMTTVTREEGLLRSHLADLVEAAKGMHPGIKGSRVGYRAAFARMNAAFSATEAILK